MFFLGGGRLRDSMKTCCPLVLTMWTSLQICWNVIWKNNRWHDSTKKWGFFILPSFLHSNNSTMQLNVIYLHPKPLVGQTHRLMWSDTGSGLIHGGAIAVTGGGSWSAEMLMVWTTGAPRATGPQRAVALRAAAVHRLHEEAVDPLAQLDDVRRGDLALAALWREDIFIKRAPENRRWGRGLISAVHVLRSEQSYSNTFYFKQTQSSPSNICRTGHERTFWLCGALRWRPPFCSRGWQRKTS